MKETDIIRALQKQAMVAAEAVNVPLRILGRSMVIPDSGYWLEQVHLPNNVTGEFWGEGKTYRGIYRLILHSKLEEVGIYPSIEKLAAVAAYFPKGAVFTSNNVSVRITEEPDLSSLIEAAPEMLFPLNIRYLSFQP